MKYIQILKGTDSISQDRIKINNNFTLFSLSIDDILVDISTLQAGIVTVEPGKLLVGQLGDVGESKPVGGVVAMDFEGNFSYKSGSISHTGLSDIGTNNHEQIDSHIVSNSNPHSVTAAQVGNSTSQWNANSIEGNLTNLGTLGATENGHAMVWDNTTSRIVTTLINSDNISNATLIFDDSHTADLSGHTWQLIDGATKRLDFQSDSNTGYGGDYLSNTAHTFRNPSNVNNISKFLNNNGSTALTIGKDGTGLFYSDGINNMITVRRSGGITRFQLYDGATEFVHLRDNTLDSSFINTPTLTIGATAKLACEEISLQGKTLISDEFVHHVATVATVDECLIDDSISFHMDGTSLAGQYKDNVGLVTPLTIGGIDTSRFIVRSAGTNTPYDDFFTAYNNCIDGDVLDVYVDETTDCSGGYWNWDTDVTINMKGHSIILSNFNCVNLLDGIDVKIIGGGSFTSIGSFNHLFDFKGSGKFTSDKTVNIFKATGGGAFQITSAAGTLEINNIYSKGNWVYAVRNNTTPTSIVTVNDCHFEQDTSLSAQGSALFYNGIIVNNTFIKGVATDNYGGNTISETSKVFNNCVIIGLDGVQPFNTSGAYINNSSVTSTNARIGTNGNRVWRNCTLTSTGTADYVIACSGDQSFYDTNIIGDNGGIYISNYFGEFIGGSIIAKNGRGVYRYKPGTAPDEPFTIKNAYIESTGGFCVGTIYQNLGRTFDISNTTLICNTINQYCISVPNNTFARFDNLKMMNTADANDIYKRADIPTESQAIQTNTSDAYGNIILQ